MVSTPNPVVRNAGDSGSFFEQQQNTPGYNPMIGRQVDPSQPKINGFSLVSNPIQPTENAQSYVKNFDPALYDLRDTSHLMRFIRAVTGASGLGGIRKQTLVARLANTLSDSAFFDLDRFYGAIFNLQRTQSETLPRNLDGSAIDPFRDTANSDLWDDIVSRDARYRGRLYQLARAINMGATYYGLVGAAEAVLNADVDVIESWIKVDLNNQKTTIIPVANESYYTVSKQYVTFGQAGQKTYGELQGLQFGNGQTAYGARGELIFTPRRSISLEERVQLTRVLNVLKPAHTMITIANETIEGSSKVTPRRYYSDSENWQIQSRVTPAKNLVDPSIPIYNNIGEFSQPRPAYGEYSGEKWSYAPNVVRASSYRLNGGNQSVVRNEETINFIDGTNHQYIASDSCKDVRQAISARLSGEGVVTPVPFARAGN